MNTANMSTRFCKPGMLRLLLLSMSSLLLIPAYAVEQPIGRLFSSPRERATLDQIRQQSSRDRVGVTVPVEEQLSNQVMLDGFVKKNNGKTTVWINQVPQHGQESPQGITILQSGRNAPVVSMRLPSGKNVNLRAGQTFDATNGKVTDVYDNVAKPVGKEPAK